MQVIVSAGIRDEIFIWNPFVEKRVNELAGHKAPMLGLHLAESRAGGAYQLLSSDRSVEHACVSSPLSMHVYLVPRRRRRSAPLFR
jgi:hypothetical protein